MKKNKEKIIIIGGTGKLGSNLKKFLKNNYDVYDYSPMPKRNNKDKYFALDLGKKESIDNFFKVKKDIKNLKCIINCVRVRLNTKKQTFDNLNKTYEITIKNYYYFIKKLIKTNNLKNINILNISSTNSILVSHQSFSYHFSKSVLENLSKFMSIEFLNRKIKVNNLRLGIIKTKDLNKIINTNKLKKITPLINIQTYNQVSNFIENTYINNKILNGTTLTLDNSLTNFDQIYFINLFNKK